MFTLLRESGRAEMLVYKFPEVNLAIGNLPPVVFLTIKHSLVHFLPDLNAIKQRFYSIFLMANITIQ